MSSQVVFVGNLPFTATSSELLDWFASLGPVVAAEVILNGKGLSRGFGRAEFSTVEDAAFACQSLNETEWDGRVIVVRSDRGRDPVTIESRGLYVGNLAQNATWQALKDLFKDAGDVERCDVPLDSERKSKGFAIVVMQTVEDAIAAYEMFNGVEWNGRTLDIRADRHSHQPYAEKETYNNSKPSHHNTTGDTLFVGNLSFRTTQQDVIDMFEQYAPTEVILALDPKGRSRGHAKVRFTNSEDAAEAISYLDGAEVDDRVIQVRVDSKVATKDKREHRDGNRNQAHREQTHREVKEPRVHRENRGQQDGAQIYVGNLPFSMRWQDLKDLFKERGDPTHATVLLDSNNRSRGFGLVRFNTFEEAEEAVAEVNGMDVSGRVLTVRLDKYESTNGANGDGMDEIEQGVANL